MLLWLAVCVGIGGSLGFLVVARRGGGSPETSEAILGILVGAALGALLGCLPGPFIRRVCRWWAGGCYLICEWLAHRKLTCLKRLCETATGEAAAEMRVQLAAACWLEGAEDQAEQILVRLLESESASPLARHNYAVTQAAAKRLSRAEEGLARARRDLPDCRPLLWNLGLVRWNQRMLSEAAEAFGELLELTPDDADARNAYALCLARQGDFEKSIEELEKGLVSHRRHPDVLCNLGLVHQASGRVSVAEQYFTGALQKQPAHIAARYNRGLCAMLRGRYHAALDDFAALLRVDRKHAWTLVQQAICWHRLGRSGRALEAMRQALRCGDSSFSVHYNAGTLMLREQLADAALQELERAYELNPHEVDAIINLGVGSHLAGRPRRALDHFRAATRLNSRHALARYNCAVSYNMAGMLEEPEEQLEELLKTYPDFPEAFNALGILRLMQNRLVEASAQFRRAVDAMPRSAVVRVNLGLTYYLQGDLAAAAEQTRFALTLDPALASGRDIAGHTALALGELVEAIEHFHTLAKLEPSNPDAHSNLGLSYYNDDRLNEAIECYKRALIFAPQSPEGHNDLGLAFAKNRMLKEALHHFTKVAEWQPGNVVVRSNMGVVYYFRGDAEGAVEQWREVTRLSPVYARRRQATRFSTYDDQEIAVRPIEPRQRVMHFPLKVAGYRHSFQLAMDENAYRMDLGRPDLRAAAAWQERGRRARAAMVRP